MAIKQATGSYAPTLTPDSDTIAAIRRGEATRLLSRVYHVGFRYGRLLKVEEAEERDGTPLYLRLSGISTVSGKAARSLPGIAAGNVLDVLGAENTQPDMWSAGPQVCVIDFQLIDEDGKDAQP